MFTNEEKYDVQEEHHHAQQTSEHKYDNVVDGLIMIRKEITATYSRKTYCLKNIQLFISKK